MEDHTATLLYLVHHLFTLWEDPCVQSSFGAQQIRLLVLTGPYLKLIRPINISTTDYSHSSCRMNTDKTILFVTRLVFNYTA